jgi:hypothetical protein
VPSQYSLFATDARVLRQVDADSGTDMHALSALTQLTPTKIRDVVTRLETRGLVRLPGDGPECRLTGEGLRIQRLLDWQLQKGTSLNTPPPVLILPDEAFSDPSVSGMNREQVSDAIRDEIAALDGDKAQG